MLIHISSPHMHGGNSIRITMLTVMIALLPATIVSVYLFGWLAVLHLCLCIGACMGSEWLALRLMGRPTTPVLDGSAALTGLFIALILPAAAPWWIALLGSIFAIILGKQVYGGIGYNPFNPALSARIILLISFPLMMTTWVVPMHLGGSALNLYDFNTSLQIFIHGIQSIPGHLDAMSMATPLGHVKTAATQGIPVIDALKSYDYNLLDAFLGSEAGSMGETSALALLIGGIYLLARHTITWHIPFSYLITVAVLALIFSSIDPNQYAPPLFHLLAGGLMLCAFFMATDPVSSPVTPLGQIVFGVGCGVLTWCIRTWGGYPEGAMFAVVLMNMAVPLIDHYCRPRPYGRKT
ncbi:MAG: electron transporter RnfD [Zetaproteobacteria bacterium CG_4_9_14_3_um_filter_49_83]|nr:MAG: electron transporter RnfD [Zetaproteobacteria bacterium CG1_02_49_23]PIQ31890.1 MAG: electron transporter RnfD [Zetaproteobacteria bacterium CG17_big_fil_post_rev_8_21_14_2_50_50_13]PIY55423.1 MAG: electron transporter RnfD [Zetaproteobacteria bacterium CG_4_10_14_0_8_um_filter_49_80]PJA34562.1 MAG: electron transporter RnfD [Zetaproteobacteria bacterium CG_4_9_14_3_um_filter_49_83]